MTSCLCFSSKSSTLNSSSSQRSKGIQIKYLHELLDEEEALKKTYPDSKSSANTLHLSWVLQDQHLRLRTTNCELLFIHEWLHSTRHNRGEGRQAHLQPKRTVGKDAVSIWSDLHSLFGNCVDRRNGWTEPVNSLGWAPNATLADS